MLIRNDVFAIRIIIIKISVHTHTWAYCIYDIYIICSREHGLFGLLENDFEHVADVIHTLCTLHTMLVEWLQPVLFDNRKKKEITSEVFDLSSRYRQAYMHCTQPHQFRPISANFL